jgi:CDGSH-type Zn-finger protein
MSSDPDASRPLRDKDAVVITAYRDGPLIVRGPFRLLAADASPIENTRAPTALCRCGKSRRKPFCDGTHKLTAFRA